MTTNLRCHHDMTGADMASSPKQPSPKQRWRESFAGGARWSSAGGSRPAPSRAAAWPASCRPGRNRGRPGRPVRRARRCVRCRHAGFCEQPSAPPQLAHRVPGDLVIVHRRAAADRGVIGGLAERLAGENLCSVDRPPLVSCLAEMDTGKCAARAPDSTAAGPVPLEYSIVSLTCAVTSWLVGLPGAAQDCLRAGSSATQPRCPGVPRAKDAELLEQLCHGRGGLGRATFGCFLE
jgi:hypothetical protein